MSLMDYMEIPNYCIYSNWTRQALLAVTCADMQDICNNAEFDSLNIAFGSYLVGKAYARTTAGMFVAVGCLALSLTNIFSPS